MTRNIHDAFAKELMEEMLPTFGTIDRVCRIFCVRG
jgi:hypothetical protein